MISKPSFPFKISTCTHSLYRLSVHYCLFLSSENFLKQTIYYKTLSNLLILHLYFSIVSLKKCQIDSTQQAVYFGLLAHTSIAFCILFLVLTSFYLRDHMKILSKAFSFFERLLVIRSGSYELYFLSLKRNRRPVRNKDRVKTLEKEPLCLEKNLKTKVPSRSLLYAFYPLCSGVVPTKRLREMVKNGWT